MNTVLQKLAVLTVMMLTYLCASAYDFDTGGFYYDITNATAKEVEVTSGDNGYSGSIVVPSTVTYNNEQYTVTAIGNFAFHGCDGLTSITLPNSLTAIGIFAFFECRGLTSITLPNSLTAIGEWAFSNCYRLTSIILPNSLTTIGRYTFAGCEDLTSITLPNSVKTIGEGVFISCSGLTSVTLPNSLTAIGDIAFSGCFGLTSIILPNSLTAIGYRAFDYCSGLTSITLPNSLTAIGESAFSNCRSLTSIDVDSGNQMYSSVDGILYDNTQTSLICCPGGKTGDVIVPNTVTAIDDYAFAYCNDLTSITLPNSVTSIGNMAFAYCSGLTSITSHAVTPPGCGFYAFNDVDQQKCFLFVPAESIEAYKQAEGWKDFAYIDEIGAVRNFEVDGIYYNVTDKTAMEVEVTKGENAYSGEITVPSTVTYNNKTYTVTAIGEKAFWGCTGLTSIDVDSDNQMYSSVDGILYDKAQTYLIYCPEGKTGDAIIPNTVTAIGEWAFAGCPGLISITSHAITPPGCGDYAFGGIDKEICILYVPAESIDAYRQATGWKDFAFIDEIGAVRNIFEVDGICYNVTDPTTKEVEVTKRGIYYSGSIVVPSSVTYNNTQYSVTAIGDEAFSECLDLTSITLPNSVTTIGEGVFYDCENLTSITLPNSLTTIGEFAFYGCYGLTSITSYAVTPPGCRDYAFGVINDCFLFVPAESIDAYKQAPVWKDFAFIDEIGSVRIFEVDGIRYIVTDKTAKEVKIAKGENAYRGNITVPSTVTYNNTQYTVTAIGDEAFYRCSSLTSITLPNSLTAIGERAFSNCYSLTSIILPNSVTAIGYRAFAYCDGLTSITLPNSLTTIGRNAFSGCSGLTSITSLAVTPPGCGVYAFDDVDKQNCILYVPAESVDAYKEAPVWKEFGIIKEADPALGIGAIEADPMADEDVEVFNLNGAKVSDTLENLPAGMFIVRNGSTVRKVVIR